MEIVRSLAGFSMGGADQVRRAMSKKKGDVMIKVRKDFIFGSKEENIDGALSRGISEDVATKIFDKMMDFAKYAFNKSHAAAYAVVAYQTAYLKHHYPVEFFAALMSSFLDNITKISGYMQVCRRLNIPVSVPDIQASQADFSVENGQIRFGLAAIKNVGRNFISDLTEERNKNGIFKSFRDFCTRMHKYGTINKRAVEAMIKSGAFDRLDLNRAQMLLIYEHELEIAGGDRKSTIDGQISFFGDSQSLPEIKEEIPNVPELDLSVRLSQENEFMGVYISGHPIDKYKDILKGKVSADILKIRIASEDEANSSLKDSMKVTIAGMIETMSVKITKRNEKMAIISVSDQYGSVDVLIFSRLFQAYGSALNKGNPIVICGKLSIQEEREPSILCEAIYSVHNAPVLSKLYLKIEQKNEEKIEKILKICEKYHGDVPVILYYERTKEKKMAPEKYNVILSDEFFKEIHEILDNEAVKVITKERG